MWQILWNIMAVIGSMFTIVCLILLACLVASGFNEQDMYSHNHMKKYFNRKDDNND